ncbi:Sphingolipid delta(4)-desaturase DES1 [Hypsibius exemplaris]|uniref:sphingolipid 4-desaturase n=1 Tax=Hypsibius exemplaris TaxID=2072580 RepID=A0A1W0W9Q9_HYPEX|nr:Sphingolipid delta(4)-desaturase DES1 [Hypsibius exemplaris]
MITEVQRNICARMGAQNSRLDFEWVYDDEPHATRRKEMLQKYPQLKKLMGPDHHLKYWVTLLVITQIIACWMLHRSDASWMTVLILGYCFGGVINHAMTLAVHEIAHNLAFGHAKPLLNRAFGMFANLPIGIPMSISFKKYHLEHHRYQGDEILDTDIPCELEARIFCNTLMKVCWVLLQPFFYAFRPFFVNPKAPTRLEHVNLLVQVSFDLLIWYFWGVKPVVYLIGGTLLAMGLHPVAGHFISEHYMFLKGHETYSYYGPLNYVTFNVGYHMEHHDFPYIAGSKLEQVRRIAPEYYDHLPQYTSWCKVIYDFITDPEIGPYARIRRKNVIGSGQNGELITQIIDGVPVAAFSGAVAHANGVTKPERNGSSPQGGDKPHTNGLRNGKSALGSLNGIAVSGTKIFNGLASAAAAGDY